MSTVASVIPGRIRTAPTDAETSSRSLTPANRLYRSEGSMQPTLPHPRHTGSVSKYQQRAQAKYAAAFDRLVSPWAIITTDCETEMCLNLGCMDVLEPVKLSYASGQCVYCGEPSSGYDHLMPRAWTGDQHRKQVAIVPCCANCNSTISDTLALSVSERRSICHDRLRRRYRVLLSSPEQTAKEWAAMGYVMRQSAKAYRAKKRATQARLAWPIDPNYDRRAFERSGIDFATERGLA